jgi:predicted nucleic acid-binding protein
VCATESLTLEIHERGMAVAEQYNLSVYDSMIVAAALVGKCNILYSEDMQDGLLIDQRLRIHNPFIRS